MIAVKHISDVTRVQLVLLDQHYLVMRIVGEWLQVNASPEDIG